MGYKQQRRLAAVNKLRPIAKPRDGKRYLTGDFAERNPKKYVGDYPITFRSSYELLFMFKMEANPRVKAWAAEQIVIPYQLREKRGNEFVMVRHNYHTDATVWLHSGEVYVCEIKPMALSPLNEAQLHNSWVHYKNGEKWRYALQWCKNQGYIFKVINESHLKTAIF
jgi:hypothetical protein